MKNADIFLNQQQKEALEDVEGAVLVSAGAGSGKTRVLTQRIAYILQNNLANPFEILAITFTNKAANEMKERLISTVEGSQNVWVSTFHSMCARILRAEISKMGYNSNFTIYDENDSESIIKKNLTEESEENRKEIIKEIKFHKSQFKNQNCTLEEYRLQNQLVSNIDEIVKQIKEYENQLKKNNALDFDDLIQKTILLFQTLPEVKNYYSNRFKYILVDEFQDTNKAQFELVMLLSSIHKNIFVVGDENQCIYSWRGANKNNMMDFLTKFNNVKIHKLEQNYRSTKQILLAANMLISKNKEKFDKKLWTDNEGGDAIEYKEAFNEIYEADMVSNAIYQAVSQGAKYSDFAILLRLNALTLPFENKFVERNIPYKVFGGFKFYEREEIKNIVAYLRLFTNPKDDVSFSRIINFPKRKLGKTSVDKLKEIANQSQKSMLEVIVENIGNENQDAFISKFNCFASIYKTLFEIYETTPPTEFIINVIKAFGINNAYDNDEKGVDKKLNIDAFIKSAEEFFDKNPTYNLPEFMENIALMSDLDTMDESNNVIVATIHSAKGLEFKNVFICGAEETIFPISRAFGEPKEMEEERRLMYVAITRAKKHLAITSCKYRYLYGKNNYMTPSRFIGEAGLVSNSFTPQYQKPYQKELDTPLPSVVKVFENKFNIETILEQPQQQKKQNVNIYEEGQMVLHPKFGIGTIEILDLQNKFATINFKGFGNKTLFLEVAPLKIITPKN